MNRTDALVDRFLSELTRTAPAAVWAHGSLAGGDYQEGRSDLDLIAVLDGPLTPRTVWRVAKLHARLRAEPLAAQLHCTYLTPDTMDHSERRHLTWAHEELFRRPVTPVTRGSCMPSAAYCTGRRPRDCCRRSRTGSSASSSCVTSGTSGGLPSTTPRCGPGTFGSTWG